MNNLKLAAASFIGTINVLLLGGTGIFFNSHASCADREKPNFLPTGSIAVIVEKSISQLLNKYAVDCMKGNRATSYDITIRQLPDFSEANRCVQSPDVVLSPKTKNHCGGVIYLTVSCLTDANPWSISAKGSVNYYRPALVSANNITKKSRLIKENVITKEVDITKLARGYFVEPEELADMSVRRHMPQGQVIQPDMLLMPNLVRRHETVSVEAVKAGVTVKLEAKALENGKKNDLVQLKNLSSGRTFFAKVIGEGKVSLAAE